MLDSQTNISFIGGGNMARALIGGLLQQGFAGGNINIIETDEWIHAVQQHDFTNMDSTMTFDGLVARAEWLF